jgi:hypothetical protein
MAQGYNFFALIFGFQNSTLKIRDSNIQDSIIRASLLSSPSKPRDSLLMIRDSEL